MTIPAPSDYTTSVAKARVFPVTAVLVSVYSIAGLLAVTTAMHVWVGAVVVQLNAK